MVLRGCGLRLLLLVLLAGALYAGFRWGGDLVPDRFAGWQLPGWGGGAEEAPPAPSEEAASSVLVRYERLASGTDRTPVRLDEVELTSVILYAAPDLLPAGMSDPTIRIRNGELQLGARMALDAFPQLPDLDGALHLLPDTVRMELRGHLVPFRGAGAAFVVFRIDAAGVPLPRRLHPQVLHAVGRRDRTGLPETAIALPLPDGIQKVYLEDAHLVLVGGT